jgi:hypothetical protein
VPRRLSKLVQQVQRGADAALFAIASVRASENTSVCVRGERRSEAQRQDTRTCRPAAQHNSEVRTSLTSKPALTRELASSLLPFASAKI